MTTSMIGLKTVPYAKISPKMVSFGGMDSEPMLIPRENPFHRKKISPEEDGTHDPASSRTASSTHYPRAIPAGPRPPSDSFHSSSGLVIPAIDHSIITVVIFRRDNLYAFRVLRSLGLCRRPLAGDMLDSGVLFV